MTTLPATDRRIARRPRLGRIALIALGIAALVFLGVTFLRGDRSRTVRVQGEALTIARVQRGDFEDAILVTGRAEPRNTHYLDAVEGGRIERVYVENGTLLVPGDPIVDMSNTALELQIMDRESESFMLANELARARLELDRAILDLRSEKLQLEAELDEYQRRLARSRELREEQLVSEEDHELVVSRHSYLSEHLQLARDAEQNEIEYQRRGMEQMKASRAHLLKNLEALAAKRNSLRVRSPVVGRITSLAAEVGESKQPGDRLGQIDGDGFKVIGEVPEHHLERVEAGQSGTVVVMGNEHRVSIERVDPQVRDGRFEVDFAFAGPAPDGIRRGQTVRISLITGSGASDALLLPRGAFFQETGGQWVFVVDAGSSTAQRRQVRLGRQNADYFEVADGLAEGEEVIISSYSGLSEFARVVIAGDISVR